jgi:glycosyltransferase involved in cell wall biosynthesis
MKIAYYVTVAPPPDPALDAAFREVESLRRELAGPLTTLYPASAYRPWVPRRWLRPAQKAAFLRHDAAVDLHHLATDVPFDYPVLRRLRRPLVCRLLLTPPSGRPAALRCLARAAAVVVSSDGEAARLRAWGLREVAVIAPGIDLERFHGLSPATGDFTLLMASAPWTRRQFRTKGIDALLGALRERPRMRLILLWRGVLVDAARRRVAAAGLGGRVEIVDRPTDVTAALARAHAVVLVASSPRVVKAFPHSLLEGLAAGRPVVTSSSLAIADLVRDSGAGIISDCEKGALGAALDRLAGDLQRYRDAALGLDLRRFSRGHYLAAYRALYERLAATASGAPAIRD